ncbi:MAG TPA: hypothetical protein VGG02_10000 [Chthoniobacterales bacterium]|jgi:hypothetical protein
MKKDFVPDSFQNLRDWADHLSTEIVTQGPIVSWSPAQVTAFQTPVGAVRDAAQAVLDKQVELDLAVGGLHQIMNINMPTVRRSINNLKTGPGYHIGIGQDLGVVTPAEQKVDTNTYQPDLKVIMVNGHPRLTGKKRGVDSFNVYVRIAGTTAWVLLAAKRVKFPFDDDSPVAHPGTPEAREYQIIGVIGDDEVGQPSNIASAVVPG